MQYRMHPDISSIVSRIFAEAGVRDRAGIKGSREDVKKRRYHMGFFTLLCEEKNRGRYSSLLIYWMNETQKIKAFRFLWTSTNFAYIFK